MLQAWQAIVMDAYSQRKIEKVQSKTLKKEIEKIAKTFKIEIEKEISYSEEIVKVYSQGKLLNFGIRW